RLRLAARLHHTSEDVDGEALQGDPLAPQAGPVPGAVSEAATHLPVSPAVALAAADPDPRVDPFDAVHGGDPDLGLDRLRGDRALCCRLAHAGRRSRRGFPHLAARAAGCRLAVRIRLLRTNGS